MIAVPLGLLTFINKMDLLVKISQYSIYAIGAYAIFIVYVLINNISSDRVSKHFSDVNLFSFNFGHITGAVAIGYSIQTTIGPIIKENAN